MYVKDQAICIRKTDYSDSSQILTFFCRDSGKINAIAKGAKRNKSSFGSPVNLFSAGQAVYIPPSGNSLAILTEFEHLPAFVRLSSNLLVMSAATMSCELISLLTDEYDPHTGLYDKFFTFLSTLNLDTSREHCLSVLIVFELGLLAELGTAIPINNCGNCNNALNGAKEVYFCAETGGFVCRDCEASFADKLRVCSNMVEAITNPLKLETVGQETLRQVQKLLIHHFAYMLNKMPKTASFFLAQMQSQ